MADDPFVQWRQSIPLGIYRDGDWDPTAEGPYSAWHAGRDADILPRADGSVLIAAEHGGVWHVTSEDQAALCLTDGIGEHQFNRLAFGPSGEAHVFAGGASLWVTDPSDPVPLRSWRQITSFTHGTIWDILILGRTIVVAAEGIWWADIPGLGSAGFVWRQALVETDAGRVPTGLRVLVSSAH